MEQARLMTLYVSFRLICIGLGPNSERVVVEEADPYVRYIPEHHHQDDDRINNYTKQCMFIQGGHDYPQSAIVPESLFRE